MDFEAFQILITVNSANISVTSSQQHLLVGTFKDGVSFWFRQLIMFSA